MVRSLAKLNLPESARAVDAREEAARIKRRAAADDLHRRSAPYELVMNEHAAAAPAPLELGPLPLAPRAFAVLGLVASYIARGFDGVELGGVDIVRLFHRAPRDGWSTRNVWAALASLRRSGYLQRVTRTVPVEETKLRKAYVSMTAAGRRELARRQGRRGRKLPPRCLHSEAPDAYARSQVRNLWTLGTKARAAKIGTRGTCGQLRAQLALTANCTATFLPSSSAGPKSDCAPALRIVAEPVNLWTTDGETASTFIEASAPRMETCSPSSSPPSPARVPEEPTTTAPATPGSCDGCGGVPPPGTVRAWIGSLWRRFRDGVRP